MAQAIHEEVIPPETLRLAQARSIPAPLSSSGGKGLQPEAEADSGQGKRPKKRKARETGGSTRTTAVGLFQLERGEVRQATQAPVKVINAIFALAPSRLWHAQRASKSCRGGKVVRQHLPPDDQLLVQLLPAMSITSAAKLVCSFQAFTDAHDFLC